jgi:hypothetical protein
MAASSTGVSCDISGILICRVGLVLKVHKKLGYFDLALVSGIFSLALAPESLLLVRSVVRKSVRILHWNNQASLRLRCVRDLHYYFLLPCTRLFMVQIPQFFSASCRKLLHFVILQLSYTFGTLLTPI